MLYIVLSGLISAIVASVATYFTLVRGVRVIRLWKRHKPNVDRAEFTIYSHQIKKVVDMYYTEVVFSDYTVSTTPLSLSHTHSMDLGYRIADRYNTAKSREQLA
jgi:hypothetical protein